ncbi:MAG: chemotaxis protein CheW [Peptococcaceae bacterium]
MADKQIVVFSLLSEEYGLEITSVKEIVRFQQVTKIPEAPVYVKGVINLRGEVIPVVDLKQRFYGLDSEITEDTRIVVLKVGANTIGIIADEVSEVLRIPEDSIEPTPAILTEHNKSGIVGVGKLADRLLILIDMQKTLGGEELQKINKAVS